MKNLNINGSGHVDGGVYDTITINGSGHVQGDLCCTRMTINGSGRVNGNLKTDGTFTINGSGSVEGSITGKGKISLNGSGRIQGNVQCHTFQSDGSAHVCGDCEGETIEMHGSCTVDGLVNGETIFLELFPHAEMHIGSIGGTNIQVLPKHQTEQNSPWKRFGISVYLGGFNAPGALTTDTIEGDSIELWETEASVVSGRAVKIGPGCKIGRVEYTQSLEVAETAAVEQSIQVQ